ncbi:MAG: SH3 domain-containing protein [Chloroflexota bacterium]
MTQYYQVRCVGVGLLGMALAVLSAGCAPRITLNTPTPDPPSSILPVADGPTTLPVAGNSTSTPAATVDYAAAVNVVAEVRVRPLVDAVNIRRGPDTSYEIAGVLAGDATARVLSRDATATWLSIVTDGGLVGWVATNVVEFVSGSLEMLAIATSEPPTATATALPPPPPPPADKPSAGPTINPLPSPTTAPTETLGLPMTKVPTPDPAPTDTPNPYP